MSIFKCNKNGFYLILRNNNRYEFTRIKNKSKKRKALIDLKQTDNFIKKLEEETGYKPSGFKFIRKEYKSKVVFE